jgi:hypothetical protein
MGSGMGSAVAMVGRQAVEIERVRHMRSWSVGAVVDLVGEIAKYC